MGMPFLYVPRGRAYVTNVVTNLVWARHIVLVRLEDRVERTESLVGSVLGRARRPSACRVAELNRRHPPAFVAAWRDSISILRVPRGRETLGSFIR